MSSGGRSLPQGQAKCRTCRFNGHGTYACYRRGCRCEQCRLANSLRSKRWRSSGRETLYRNACEWCGAWFESTHSETRCCSQPCAQWKLRHEPSMCRALATIPPKPAQVAAVSTARRLTSGQCRVCRAWFVSIHAHVVCSTACQSIKDRERRHQGAARRRARKRGAYRADVRRTRVFEGDGYRCHLCGKKCRKGAKVPQPKAPTIDHVVPLNVGGTHEPVNCRTACFLCNATKRDQGGGEQLLLIA